MNEAHCNAPVLTGAEEIKSISTNMELDVQHAYNIFRPHVNRSRGTYKDKGCKDL